MNMERVKERALVSWASVALMAVVACVLAVLQYRWIGEVAVAERDRLREALQTAITRFSQDFNGELAGALSALRLPSQQIEAMGREEAYEAGYARLKENPRHEKLLKRIALAIPQGKVVKLQILDPVTGRFQESAWPKDWSSLRHRLQARVGGSPMPPFEF
jgi:hypothetical protein